MEGTYGYDNEFFSTISKRLQSIGSHDPERPTLRQAPGGSRNGSRQDRAARRRSGEKSRAFYKVVVRLGDQHYVCASESGQKKPGPGPRTRRRSRQTQGSRQNR